MKRHPRRSDEEWLNIIKECRTSGLPDKTWCKDHGIQPSKFYYHIRRLKAKACTITERSHEPHETVQKQEAILLSFDEQPDCIPWNNVLQPGAKQMEPAVRISFHGIQLEISNYAERETIANTLSVLHGLC